MYRANAQSRSLEERFIRAELPYKLVGGTRFYERKEIKDMLAYLAAVVNEDDDIATRRAITVPKRGIGDVAIEGVDSAAPFPARRFTQFRHRLAVCVGGGDSERGRSRRSTRSWR